MKKHLSLIAAAALSLGGIAFAQDAAKPADNAAPAPDVNSQTSALVPSSFKDANRVRDTLTTATQAAVTKGGFDDLIERLVDADRNRIGQTKLSDDDKKVLDGIVEQISKDWKDKYHEDFKIKDEAGVFNDQFAKIEEGEMGGSAKLAAEQIKNTQERTAEQKDNANGNDKGDQNLEKGRDIATVTIAASHGLPELKVPMIKEASLTGPYWKINVPDDVDGAKLKDNLQKHLTMVKDAKDKWPADPNEAYRAVSHHVLAALLNQDMAPSDAGGAAK